MPFAEWICSMRSSGYAVTQLRPGTKRPGRGSTVTRRVSPPGEKIRTIPSEFLSTVTSIWSPPSLALVGAKLRLPVRRRQSEKGARVSVDADHDLADEVARGHVLERLRVVLQREHAVYDGLEPPRRDELAHPQVVGSRAHVNALRAGSL